MNARRADAARALAALVAAACGPATAPDRPAPYDFEERGSGAIFWWPADRLPVRYWVDPAAGVVADYVARALQTWQDQFLYAEFRGVLVTDSSRADVLVRVEGPTPPDVPLTNDPPVPVCGGSTGFDPPDAADRFPTPPRIRLQWAEGADDVDVANCLSRVVAHEVGHSLGILAESPNDLDLMNTNVRVSAPSAQDRATAEVLYHTPPNVLPPERPR
jgi:hypothetical protein